MAQRRWPFPRPGRSAAALVGTPLALLAVTLFPGSTAQAGGYDTPILYSARHIGMGGTAVAFVNDPSAIFHNPAGLASIEGRASFLGDFSLLLGSVRGSPEVEATSADSELTVAPFFLVGGAAKFDVNDDVQIAVGGAVYPVAAASARYEVPYSYGPDGTLPSEDETRLIFFEFSPAVAVRLFDRVNLGVGYRVTYVSLSRQQGPLDEGAAPTIIDIDMAGFNFAGFRVGAQWEAVEDHLSFGIQYRHQTTTELTADDGFLRIGGASTQIFDLSSEFILPSRLSAGVRGDFDRFGVAFDVEYGFNSQNDSNTISGQGIPGPGIPRIGFDNVSEWSDAVTLRVGGEYDIPINNEGHTISPRLGYIFDAKTVNEVYPTAFGTPPAATHVFTAGVGYDRGPFEVNLAYAFRQGGTTVGPIPDDARECAFCSEAGEYKLTIHGLYVDLSYEIE